MIPKPDEPVYFFVAEAFAISRCEIPTMRNLTYALHVTAGQTTAYAMSTADAHRLLATLRAMLDPAAANGGGVNS